MVIRSQRVKIALMGVLFAVVAIADQQAIKTPVESWSRLITHETNSVIKLFSKEDFDINAPDRDGDTILLDVLSIARTSVYSSHDKINITIDWTERIKYPLIKLLLENGADQNILDNSGNLCILQAVQKDYPRIVELLLDQKLPVPISQESVQKALSVATKQPKKYYVISLEACLAAFKLKQLKSVEERN